MARLAMRLLVCVFVWPPYYASVLVRGWVDGLRWLGFRQSLEDAFRRDDRVMEQLQRPPFIDRLRG